MTAHPRRGGRHRRRRDRSRNRHALGMFAAACALLFTGSTLTPAAADSAPGRKCHDLDAPVTSGALTATMRASLCTPASGGDVLQVLVAGGIR
ncbi:MAG TPA: hypothetical protein VGL46_09575 [Pseudonocardiaceae bacterium]